MGELAFTVLGKPQTAGSKRAFPIKRKNGTLGVVVSDDNKQTKNWQAAVRDAAMQVFAGGLLTGPLHVEMRFFFVRPASHYGSGRNAGQVKASAPLHAAKRPDVLKLSRAVEDALTGVVWRDDAQIVVEVLTKEFGEPTRAEVEISAIYTIGK